jgi:aminocarboxymuconate-semialdehyde decarboxylase
MSAAAAQTFRHFCPKCLDFHAHFIEPEVFKAAQPHSVSSCFGRELLPVDSPAVQRMLEPELQIEDMEKRGIDLHVLSSCDVVQSRAWAAPKEEARLTAIVNDHCASWVDRFPGRFIGSAALPVGDMTLTLAELERSVAMGFRILNMPTHYRGQYLGERRYADFWSAVDEHELVVFIHPHGIDDMWYQPYAMWNSIGQSIEEVRVMTSLIYEGVMEQHPGIKIVMAHGGGYMPHYMGRLDRNVTDKPFTVKNLSKKPSEYLKDFYYDSCVYDSRTLELLIERVGIDRVVLGGDYPVAAIDPLDFLATVNITDSDRAAIAGGNACRLLTLV